MTKQLMITAAQLWYIMTVYPECITHHEIEKEFEKWCKIQDVYKHGTLTKNNDEYYIEPLRKEETEQFLWEYRAKKINELFNP